MHRLVPQGIRRGRAPGLEAVHGVPFVETRAVGVDPLLVVRGPRVRRAAREVVALASVCAGAVQRLQRRPATVTVQQSTHRYLSRLLEQELP